MLYIKDDVVWSENAAECIACNGRKEPAMLHG